jgi:predicted nucleic acid-binding protein
MSFLVDTDICSAHLKGDRVVSSRFLQYSGRLHVSVLTVSELYTWAKRSGAPPARLVAVRDMLMAARLIDVNDEVAERAGELRAALLNQGRPMPSTDLLIAATALVHGLTLVTHNVRHFQNVPNLAVEDWLVP